MPKYLVSCCLLAVLAVGCSSSGKRGPDDDENDDPSGVSSYAQLSSVAKMIYDSVEAGEDVSSHIEGVFEAFGVPTLAADDIAGAQERMDAGLPFVTSNIVAHMATAYALGDLVGAESFSEGLIEQNVGLAYPYNQGGNELSPDFLGGMLYAFGASGSAQPDIPLQHGYVLPSLVWALGQERASRVEGGTPDPMWGDGRLDPLQFSLLSFTVFAKPARVSQTSRATAADGLTKGESFVVSKAPVVGIIAKKIIKEAIKDYAKDQLTSVLQDFLEVPLDPLEAASVSVCASLILYGHKTAMTNTPALLWHAPLAPNVTTVEMTLTFEDEYPESWRQNMARFASCEIPPKGPVSGKQVKWSVSSALERHGNYDVMQPITDDSGKAVASWRTVEDDIPETCRILTWQRDAVGATEAVVSGLLPGWSSVERTVTFLNPNTGNQGNAPLTVMYYKYDVSCHPD